jgi:hypothetical protein
MSCLHVLSSCLVHVLPALHLTQAILLWALATPALITFRRFCKSRYLQPVEVRALRCY